MNTLRRRKFLTAGIRSAALLGLGTLGVRTLSAALRKAADFRITEIKRYEITPPYHDYNAESLFRYHGAQIQSRTILVAQTTAGIEGLGEAWGRGWPEDRTLEKYIGTSPFDWVDDMANLPVNMICYDLMGKFLGVPAWKLIGAKVRDWMPVAAWTVSEHPDAMAKEVESVTRRGYRWIKFHVGEIQNVVDQTAAMARVAPPGFKVHYDFNGNADIESVYPVLRQLEKFPIAGRVEDPILPRDAEGYRRLREKCRLPLLIHHGPIESLVENRCDGYMAGHAPIGMAHKANAVAETVNLPIMLQQAGGTINQAFLSHEVAVFKMARIDHVNLCHLWTDDITVERMPVVGSSVRVPVGPGLGVTLDRAKLEEYARAPRPQYERFLVRIRYGGGPTIYVRHEPHKEGATDNLRYVHRLLGSNAPGPVPAYANPVVSSYIDDGDAGFEGLWNETESGPHIVDD